MPAKKIFRKSFAQTKLSDHPEPSSSRPLEETKDSAEQTFES